MQNEITIKVNEVVVAKDQAGNLVLTKDAEQEIRKILDVKKILDDIYKYVQDRLEADMIANNVKKVVCGGVVVTHSASGEKYSIEDVAKASFFLKSITKISIDSDKVEEYKKLKGKLPEGIIENARPMSVRIKLRDE